MKKNNSEYYGKAFWQPIKQICEPLDNISATKWKKIKSSDVNKIMGLPEYTIDGNENKKIIELNHFIIQQVRIPLKEKPTIKKILQIALNVGQYKGLNKGKYRYNIRLNNITEFVTKTNITKLSTYIDDNMILQIEKYLDKV